MGGNIALEFATGYPEIPDSLVMVDSAVFPTKEFRDSLQTLVEAFHGPDYISACQSALRALCLLSDEEPRKTGLISALPTAPPHALSSAFRNHILEYDSTSAASGCHIPIAYIGAAVEIADLTRFRSLTKQLITAQTLGAGHFSQLFVPDQINAMIARFITVFSSKSARE